MLDIRIAIRIAIRIDIVERLAMGCFTASHALLFFSFSYFSRHKCPPVPHPHTIHQGRPMHRRCLMPTGETGRRGDGETVGSTPSEEEIRKSFGMASSISQMIFSVLRDEREVQYIHYTWPAQKRHLRRFCHNNDSRGLLSHQY